MDTKRILLLLLIFQFIVIFSQKNCIQMTLHQDKNDSLNVRFTSKCKEKVVLYQYSKMMNTTLNNGYDLEDITLLKQDRYKIENIKSDQNHNYPVDYEKVKNNFFILNPNESYDFAFPLLIFLEKNKSVYEKYQNYYLINNKHKGKTVQFKLTYNAQFINEGIINLKDNVSLYPISVESNYLKIILK
ncbi:hypothetical protein [Chryseobacterium viscerum]|uniref:hypothetical protein n=1 Tax=Chryseobacterium TaxID=59732 RepID=UPI000B147F9B|nr:hypothetical protein [Chryseobacterium viscerum]MCW1963388.1 hypothetical protein [Chryseobacterium viscerum]WPO90703.1 hypothetical protein SFA27_21240 [Chryseobacterium sp. HR92]